MRYFKLGIIPVILVTLCACRPPFEHPVASAKLEHMLDLRLVGHWVLDPAASGNNDADYAFIQFVPESSDGWLVMTAYSVKEDDTTTSHSLVLPVEIDGVGYMNVLDYFSYEEDEETSEGDFDYDLYKYEVLEGEFLRIYAVDSDKVKKAIRENRLAGTITERSFHVTASSEELIDFLRHEDIFEESTVQYYTYKDIGIVSVDSQISVSDTFE